MRDPQEFQEQVGRIDKLIQKLEAAADPVVRGTARELIQTLMELHSAGLERILEVVSGAGEAGAGVIHSLSQDALVSSLLVLYGLHPEDFQTRVQKGVENARKLLRPQGARLDVIEIADERVHLRITGSGTGDLQAAVRETLLETAPDASEVVIDGGVGAAQGSNGFVPLTSLLNGNGSAVVFADAQRT